MTEYLPRGSNNNDPYYASTIERLRCAILEKRRCKVSDGVVLLHDNTLVHKCNIVQAAIRKADFVELNHHAYSADIAASDYYPFSNLKIFLRTKNFSLNDETIDTVDDYLNNLD